LFILSDINAVVLLTGIVVVLDNYIYKRISNVLFIFKNVLVTKIFFSH